jgi:propanol-preferring alcohol dehydrogenase
MDDVALAPLLCAGLIGYRALRMCGDARRVGLYGFGASAHIICQVAVHEGREVYAFTRSREAQALALELGAVWAGEADGPEPLHAAIVFAPAGELVVTALRATDRGGVVVCAGIHMSDIPSFPYADLWHERTIRSVANLTREDGHAFMQVAPLVRTHTRTYPLDDAQRALDDLRSGALTAAAVLVAPLAPHRG